jgi:hypothetical protein
MKTWEAQIPKTPKNKDRKRCYTVWSRLMARAWAGGKVVWLTDKEKTLAYIRHSNLRLDEVLEKDKLEEYRKYMHQTIE